MFFPIPYAWVTLTVKGLKDVFEVTLVIKLFLTCQSISMCRNEKYKHRYYEPFDILSGAHAVVSPKQNH